mmetsp:Transcript_11525/g.28209  ORF Transcript_11525/g.28209 Transcript_11525/m.28209 type:complete len:148 (-) Transcript_11525:64-507(-)
MLRGLRGLELSGMWEVITAAADAPAGSSTQWVLRALDLVELVGLSHWDGYYLRPLLAWLQAGWFPSLKQLVLCVSCAYRSRFDWASQAQLITQLMLGAERGGLTVQLMAYQPEVLAHMRQLLAVVRSELHSAGCDPDCVQLLHLDSS